MKRKTHGMTFIRNTIAEQTPTYGKPALKRNRTFTVEDLKTFGSIQRLRFFQAYYNVPTKKMFYRNTLNVSKWIDRLSEHGVVPVFLSKKDVEFSLFPLTLDSKYYDDVKDFVKMYKKIVSSANGLSVEYGRKAKEYNKMREDIRSALKAGKNWAWDREKKNES